MIRFPYVSTLDASTDDIKTKNRGIHDGFQGIEKKVAAVFNPKYNRGHYKTPTQTRQTFFGGGNPSNVPFILYLFHSPSNGSHFMIPA